MDSDKRKVLQIKVHVPDMQCMKTLRDILPGNIQRKFVLRYGKILDLLKVPVQVGAIIDLAQFYDPPLRCFIFQYFQQDLTLEEFKQILDHPRKKKGPYQGIGHFLKPKDLAMTLNIPTDNFLPY